MQLPECAACKQHCCDRLWRLIRLRFTELTNCLTLSSERRKNRTKVFSVDLSLLASLFVNMTHPTTDNTHSYVASSVSDMFKAQHLQHKVKSVVLHLQSPEMVKLVQWDKKQKCAHWGITALIYSDSLRAHRLTRSCDVRFRLRPVGNCVLCPSLWAISF